jgi:hypothetical protein
LDWMICPWVHFHSILEGRLSYLKSKRKVDSCQEEAILSDIETDAPCITCSLVYYHVRSFSIFNYLSHCQRCCYECQ